MALIDQAVLTAAQGFVFTAPVGTTAPTPSELDAMDPETFGSKSVNIEVSGSPTSYTLLVDSIATSAIPLASGPAVVTAAIEALAGVGTGNVLVEGVNAADADGLDITFIGALQGVNVTVAEGTYVGGSTPDMVVTVTTAVNGWKNVGHTSRDDMPEFGFDGGDTEVKGTWQKKRLREIATGDPVADSVTINLSQWDAESLQLYYGEDSAATTGVFGVSGDFAPLERALLIVILDGSVRIGFYSPKASIKRDDAINLPVDDLASLPIKATFLNLGARRLFDWISADLL